MINELITIIIASYNADKYIYETLESCINQTYKNIQIIISDDCSQDNSVNVIKQWCEEKKKTHPSIECILVTSCQNNGITKNFNNALVHARGSWIKCLGSDDILLPTALSDFSERLSLHRDYNNIGAVFTFFETFGHHVTNPQRFPLGWTRTVSQMRPSWLKRQLVTMHFNNVAPGAFINMKYLGHFDESYRLLEDLPTWIYLVGNNIPTLFLPFVSVKYRLHDVQVTSSVSPVRKILENDLKIVNDNRFKNGYYLGYYHNKFNLYLSTKNGKFFRYLKILNPLNFVIKVCDKF